MTEKVEAPRALNDELKTVIRDAYAKLQANTPGFSTRRSQSQMIGVVSRALSQSGGVGVVEAPTGVGKSYLACALAQQACRLGYCARYLRLPRLLPPRLERPRPVPAGVSRGLGPVALRHRRLLT